jgi:hypothetical protein
MRTRKRTNFLSSSSLQSNLYNHHESKVLTLANDDEEDHVFTLTSTQNSNILEPVATSTTSAFSHTRYNSTERRIESPSNSDPFLRTSFFKSRERFADLLGGDRRTQLEFPSLSKFKDQFDRRLFAKTTPRERLKERIEKNPSPNNVVTTILDDTAANISFNSISENIKQPDFRPTLDFIKHLNTLDENVTLKERKNFPFFRGLSIFRKETNAEDNTGNQLLDNNSKPVSPSKKSNLRKILSVFIPTKTRVEFDGSVDLAKKHSLSPTTPFSSFKRSIVKSLDLKKSKQAFLLYNI